MVSKRISQITAKIDAFFFVTIPIRNSRFLSRNNKFYSYLIQLHLTQKINVINAYKYEITYSFHVIKLSSTVILHVENIIVRYDKIYCSIGSRKRLFRTTMSTRYIQVRSQLPSRRVNHSYTPDQTKKMTYVGPNW